MCRSSAWPNPAGPSSNCANAPATASPSTAAAWTTSSFQKLCELLDYVDGDYNDDKTYDQLRAKLGNGERRPTHYLAIPPSMFPVVVKGLAKSGCAKNARVILEKPFGRDLVSARKLNDTLHQAFPGRPASSASITTSAKRRWRTC